MAGAGWLARLAAVIAVASTSAATWLSVSSPGAIRDQGVAGLISTWISVLVLSVLGMRVTKRQPRQPIGWIMLAMAVVGGLTTFAEVYAFITLVSHALAWPGGALADTVGTASWVAGFAGLTWIVFLFPDGHLPSPRWRPVALLTGTAFTGAWIGATFQPGAQNPPFDHLQNPAAVAWLGGAGQIAVGFFMIGMLLCILAVAAPATGRGLGPPG